MDTDLRNRPIVTIDVSDPRSYGDINKNVYTGLGFHYGRNWNLLNESTKANDTS